MSSHFYQYKAFGLTIGSDIELPELIITNSLCVDISIVIGKVPEKLSHSTINRLTWQANERQILLNFPKVGIGRFLIENGNKITIEPSPNHPLSTLRTYLLGTAFGALFYQLRLIVFHASSLTKGNGAITICGDSGAGKSTTANALIDQGWEMMSDDLSVITAQHNPVVYPAYPQSKLWESSFSLLNKEISSFERISSNYRKFKIPVTEKFYNRSSPIKAIFIIQKYDLTEVKKIKLKGAEKLAILHKHSYRKKFVFGEYVKQHANQCAEIANSCSVYLIFRPNQKNTLNQIKNLILEEV